MILPFTLQQLRILKAVAHEKSFTRASEILFLSQPSLSKQIKMLEKKLGIVLLERQNKILSLTEEGKIFLQYSERILTLCEESCRALNDVKTGDRAILTVGASQTIGTYFMPRILALFAQNYPQISIKVLVDSTKKITENILNQKIDIALVGGKIPKEIKKNLKIEHFVEDELILIIPKCHPFTKKKIIKKSDLYNLNFITLNSTSTIRKFIDTILIQNDIEIKQLNIIMQLNSIEAIKTAVGLGLGAAFVSSSAIENEVKLKKVEILSIENLKIVRKLFILTNQKSYSSKAIKIFHKELNTLKYLNK